eukprot:Em0003g1306a
MAGCSIDANFQQSSADSQQLAQLTCNTLEHLRNQECFSLLWSKVSSMQEKLQIDEPMLPRKHKAPRRYEVGDGQGTFLETVQDYFRAKYYVVIDAALACIRQRFDQPGYQTYRRLENLLTSAANGTDYQQDLNFIAEFYGDDIDKVLLQNQMELFRSIILSAFPTTANVGVRDIVQHVCTLSPGVRMSITQVCSLVRLLLVMPATNAVSERSASALRRVKSYLRTTMTDTRLNNLLVLHVHKDRVLEDCLNEFVCGSEHRLSLFGKF